MFETSSDKEPKKTKMIHIRCDPEEKLAIEKKARKVNMTTSMFIRKCLTNKKVQGRNPPKVNWRTYRQLIDLKNQIKKIGNNINQIAAIFNSDNLKGKLNPERLEISEDLKEIKYLLRLVVKCLEDSGLIVLGEDLDIKS